MLRGIGLDLVGYVEGSDGGTGLGEGNGAVSSGSWVGVVDGFVLLEGVGDGGNFGFSLVAGGFLVHSAHGGKGDAGEDRDHGDGDEKLDEGEGGGRGRFNHRGHRGHGGGRIERKFGLFSWRTEYQGCPEMFYGMSEDTQNMICTWSS